MDEYAPPNHVMDEWRNQCDCCQSCSPIPVMESWQAVYVTVYVIAITMKKLEPVTTADKTAAIATCFKADILQRNKAMASQQQSSNTPIASRDSWQTPQWLFDYVEAEQGIFDFDLAASAVNAKVENFITIEDDSLSMDWWKLGSGVVGTKFSGWCNPPYSETGKWLEKGQIEAQHDFKSVFLVPTPNGDSYWKHVFGWATEIIFIIGRIGFIASESYTITDKKGRVRYIKKGDEVGGNSRGSCIVVFDGPGEQDTQISWVDRDTMKFTMTQQGIN